MLTYIVIVKNQLGTIVARGVGTNLNDAVDNMKSGLEDYTFEQAIRILEEEIKKGGEV